MSGFRCTESDRCDEPHCTTAGKPVHNEFSPELRQSQHECRQEPTEQPDRGLSSKFLNNWRSNEDLADCAKLEFVRRQEVRSLSIGVANARSRQRYVAWMAIREIQQ